MALMLVKDLSPLEAFDAEEARLDFKKFVGAAWHIIEPGRPYVGGWHIDGICEHLTAVTRGDIKKLLVNMPPRHSKSSIISVLWSAWLLLNDPTARLLCSSYALKLATRDNLKTRRLIKSPWFQVRYGERFNLTKDQDAKMYFETNKLGYRMAVSVGAAATGEGGDILLCLCYNSEVTTDRGRIQIGEIVDRRLPVNILAHDHNSGNARWQRIEKYEKNPGRPCVRVTFSDGRSVDTTTDHPFYVVGRGYVQASQLTNVDEVIDDKSSLRILYKGDRENALRYSKSQAHLLQSRMPLKLACHSGQLLRMPSLREGIQTPAQTCRPQYKRGLLQSCLSWHLANRRKQSCISEWSGRTYLRDMQKGVFCQTCRSAAPWREILFRTVQRYRVKRRKQSSLPEHTGCLRALWQGDIHQREQSGQAQLLQQDLRQQSTQRIYQGREQSQVCGWYGVGTLPSRISRAGAIHPRTRRATMPTLQQDPRRERQRTGCSPHRLRHLPQRLIQSGFSLPLVSREDAWISRGKGTTESLLVRSVESIATPEHVYNLRITEDHNYFANGVLVHNCDDPHAIDEKESDPKRNTAIDWFDNTWSSRLNDQQTGAMVVVGQRIHMNDVSGHILETAKDDWVHLNLPAEYDPGSACRTYLPSGKELWADPRTQEGDLLWEEKFPKPVIERAKKRHGVLGYSAIYGQQPIPPGGYVFNRGYERLFEIDSANGAFILLTPEGHKVVRITDCYEISTSDVAVKDKEQNDYTVFAHWAVTPDYDVLLLDVQRDHWSIPKQKKQAKLFYQTHYSQRYRAFYFESVGYQSAIAQDLLVEGLPCLEFTPRGDKVQRATGASVLQEAGKIYWLKGAVWMEEWSAEIYNFPKAQHDDQVDNQSMVCMIVRTPEIGELDAETANALISYQGY